MSPLTGKRPFAAFLPCFLAVLIAAAPALGQSSRSSSRSSSPRNSSSKSSGKKPSKSPSKVTAKSPQKINDADSSKPGRWARIKSFFGFGDKKSKKAPSSKGRVNIADFEDLDYGSTYDRVPAEVADAIPVYDQVPAEGGGQAGGAGQYAPGPVVQNANNPYAPGPVANPHPYDLRGLNAQANQQNQYNNRGLKLKASGNAYDAPNAAMASDVAAIAGNVAAGKPYDQVRVIGGNIDVVGAAGNDYALAPNRGGVDAPAANQNGVYQPAPNRNYAAAPANPQARAGWKVNPAPIGKQNPLTRQQFSGLNTMQVAQILDPSIRQQGGGGGNNARGNAGGQPRQGIGQGGQNLGAMAGFNRGSGQPYVVPLQRALPPGQNIYPNIKKN